jgi:spermidine synthase
VTAPATTASASAPAAPATTGTEAAGRLRQSLLLPALLALFFGSGISGLIYELVWLRHLTLVFGVTVYAVSTVLSAFMGGLALGGFLASRVADRVERPLRAYGLLEIGIGLSALLTPPAFAVLQQVYRGLYPALPHDLTSLSLVRFLLACVILLVPTTLMGATLPIVVRSTLGRRASLGTNLSLLYASNTAGGITGAYLAGFILIGSIGIRATTVTAAAVNVAVGIASIALDWWLAQEARKQADEMPLPLGEAAQSAGEGGSGAGITAARRPRPDPLPGGEGTSGTLIPSGALRWLLVAFFLSGFASLGYQVIWTRILAIFFEATTYAFTLILCTFLLGIAAGSYLIAPVINRRVNWLFAAAIMEWAIGFTALLSIAVIARMPQIVDTLRVMPLLEHTVSGEQRLTAMMCFLTIIPTTLILGAAFPVIMKLYAGAQTESPVNGKRRSESGPLPVGEGGRRPGEVNEVGRRLGRAYAANVCGSIAGSWISGFVLIPLIGTHASIILLAGANVLIGLGLLRYALADSRLPRLARPRALVPAGLALAAGAIALTPDMYAAVFARFGDRVLWYEEGLEQTVTILQGPQVRRMYLNGWHQANDTPAMVSFHSLIGHLPMLVQPTGTRAGAGSTGGGASAERRVLVVGLGGGATAGAASVYDRARLTVVELSPSVVRGARLFSHVNHNVVDAPNVRVLTDDGRNYLLLAGEKYDVIMADAIRPHAAGSAALYSLEYYHLARAALSEDGVMVQWIDNQIPEAQYRILLRTFLEAFPYVTAWADGGLFIASHRPYQIDRATLRERVEGPARRTLAADGISGPESVLGLFTATDAELRAWVGPGPVITDDHPYNEFFRSLPAEKTPPNLTTFRRDWSQVVH